MKNKETGMQARNLIYNFDLDKNSILTNNTFPSVFILYRRRLLSAVRPFIAKLLSAIRPFYRRSLLSAVRPFIGRRPFYRAKPLYRPLSLLSRSLISLMMFSVVAGYGQEDAADRTLTVDVGADMVSSYIWRGAYQAGASIQPEVSLSAFGITLGAWGSIDFLASYKEIDIYLSYEIGGFRASIADYWWSGEGESYFKHARGAHHLDASLGFTFPEKFPLSLEVSTMLHGDDDKDDEGRRYYSTYISASYPFTVGKIDCETGIGIAPHKGMYSDKFDIASISAKASKKLQLSADYSLPVFAEMVFSPTQDNVFVVFGIRF